MFQGNSGFYDLIEVQYNAEFHKVLETFCIYILCVLLKCHGNMNWKIGIKG